MNSLTASTRLLVVANRLPVSVKATGDAVSLTRSGGGLVTGLKPRHDRGDGIWIGWPGECAELSQERRRDLDGELAAERYVPVHLTSEQIERYYHGFANRVLWPLFHYQVDRVPIDASDWDAYRSANERFADATWREYRSGNTIWVHDYQLMLVPGLLRERLPDARIGFFLHIPFPSSEVFRVLPWRRQVLEGLLGADLIGFHTFAYMRHFVSSLLHVDGVEADVDRVHLRGRDVRLGAFPMGIDTSAFESPDNVSGVNAELEAIRGELGERRLILGIDRLDYTKGIPRRLQAIERMLTRDPTLADKIRYVQLAVPSRGSVDSYQAFRGQVEAQVGRINGAFGSSRSVPVHYMYKSVPPHELVALYRAADVMLVTPLRDGMNLVAKEFVASRVDHDGVLVLSEFAGAADELDGALVVNPYDVDAVAHSLQHALSLSRTERRARMATLRRQVARRDVHHWAEHFTRQLTAARPVAGTLAVDPPGPSLMSALEAARQAPELRLLLDYDGTLVPLARSPEAASPDAHLVELLDELSRVPQTRVDIVSGRPREPLEAWFGHLQLGLWAEHGFWRRSAGEQVWHAAANPWPNWQESVLPILEQFTAATPGSRIERKAATIAWHFRGAQREHGIRQAHELRMLLGTAFSNQPWGVVEERRSSNCVSGPLTKRRWRRGLLRRSAWVRPSSPSVTNGPMTTCSTRCHRPACAWPWGNRLATREMWSNATATSAGCCVESSVTARQLSRRRRWSATARSRNRHHRRRSIRRLSARPERAGVPARGTTARDLALSAAVSTS
ncbi:MAG: bifunctional alpha,alpha-trehalose-phosphate synthase (UDP-forming)/trehalose-phosphatase [Vicinamibacterales bacterium]